MKLYIVDADGGTVRPVLRSVAGSQEYPSWSPEGKKLLYGIIKSSTRGEAYIRVADLDTGKMNKFGGLEGLFAPRTSPDGETVAALQWAQRHHLMLFHVKDRRWEEVMDQRVDWLTWTRDSKSISKSILFSLPIDSAGRTSR